MRIRYYFIKWLHYLDETLPFLVCDMAGTVINENGIIYNSLEKVLKNMGCVITQEMKQTWYE